MARHDPNMADQLHGETHFNPVAQKPTARPYTAICGTTMIDTPDGPRSAGSLKNGDWITTRDNGPQQLRWTQSTWMSRQQLEANAALCPLRVRANNDLAKDLIIAPTTRILARGPLGETLMTAKMLVDCGGAISTLPRNGIVYVQLMLNSHQIILADGVAIESFHPLCLSRTRQDAALVAEVTNVFPGLEHGFDLYGPDARPDFKLLTLH